MSKINLSAGAAALESFIQIFFLASSWGLLATLMFLPLFLCHSNFCPIFTCPLILCLCAFSSSSMDTSYWISVHFSCSVVSDSLWPHESQHARPPCSSPTPGVYSNSCPSSRWCHPTISPSVNRFSSGLQSFPVSGSFQMNQFFLSSAQSIGVSASATVLPMNTQDWSPLRWTCWISLQSKGLSRVFSNITVQKHQLFLIDAKMEHLLHTK